MRTPAPRALRRPRQTGPRRLSRASAHSARNNATRGSRWPSSAKNSPLRKRPCEIRLKLRDARFVDGRMRFVPRGEAVDLTHVARRRDHQRAFPRQPGNARVPPVKRVLAQRHNAWRRAFASQNGASTPPASHDALPPRLTRSLEERDLRAPLDGVVARRDPATRADNENSAHRCRHAWSSRVPRESRLSSTEPNPVCDLARRPRSRASRPASGGGCSMLGASGSAARRQHGSGSTSTPDSPAWPAGPAGVARSGVAGGGAAPPRRAAGGAGARRRRRSRAGQRWR